MTRIQNHKMNQYNLNSLSELVFKKIRSLFYYILSLKLIR